MTTSAWRATGTVSQMAARVFLLRALHDLRLAREFARERLPFGAGIVPVAFGFQRGGVERARRKLGACRALERAHALARSGIGHDETAVRAHRLCHAERVDFPAVALARLQLQRGTGAQEIGR